MFKEIPASPTRIAKRKLICGVGVNDALYQPSITIKGKYRTCPFYIIWRGIIYRCYGKKTKANYPTYTDCTVEKSWLYFSNFKKWASTQNWMGNELDKDILIPGNKQYGPNTCLFVPPAINRLLNKNTKRRGKYPLGVSKITSHGHSAYHATCCFFGKQTKIGQFQSIDLAEQAYIKAKCQHIRKVAGTVTDPRLKTALISHIARYNGN